jgi:hypothetical protein
MNLHGEMMPFIKYVQTHLNLIVHDKRRLIKGVFRNKKSGAIIKGDNFSAILVGSGNDAEQVYKAYISWYNYTRDKGDAEREFVSAKWDEEGDDER